MNIELIKKQGSINALKNEIDNRIHSIRNHTWDSIKTNGNYSSLAEACNKNKNVIAELEALLKELQALQPANI